MKRLAIIAVAVLALVACEDEELSAECQQAQLGYARAEAMPPNPYNGADGSDYMKSAWLAIWPEDCPLP
jgi:Tfp pilus assembly protein PilV